MATSKLPAILDYLVATYTAASALAGVAVYDGPAVTAEPAQRVLWVGVDDPDSDEAFTAASGEQTWAALGTQAKTEQFTVNHTAEAWGGETEIAQMRTAVFAIVAAVEDIVRGDVMLGGRVQFQGVAGVTLRQDQTTRGAVARVMFQITGQARI